MTLPFNRRLLLAAGAAILASHALGAVGQVYGLRRRGTRLYLDVRINGTSVEALLDSAAETTLGFVDKGIDVGIGF